MMNILRYINPRDIFFLKRKIFLFCYENIAVANMFSKIERTRKSSILATEEIHLIISL